MNRHASPKHDRGGCGTLRAMPFAAHHLLRPMRVRGFALYAAFSQGAVVPGGLAGHLATVETVGA